MLVLPRHYARQKPALGARIDWGHPLARGLVGCWLFNEGGGLVASDLACSSRVGTITTPAELLWTSGPGGMGLKSTAHAGTTRGVTLAPAVTLGDGTALVFSWDALILPTTGGTSYDTLLTQAATIGIWFNGGSLINNFYMGGDHNSGAMTGNEVHHIAITTSGSAGSHHLNGRNNGDFSFTPAAIAFDAMANDLSSETFIGDIYFQRLWNRTLSPDEVRWLSVEPYAFLIAPRRLWVPTVAGGAQEATLLIHGV